MMRRRPSAASLRAAAPLRDEEAVTVEAQDLTISRRRANGERHIMHVTECTDLDMVLAEGHKSVQIHEDIPARNAKSVVVVLLDVDDMHDQVLYDDVNALENAIEALTAARRTADQIARFVR